MRAEYSVEVCKKLEDEFHSQRLHRPMRVERYDAGSKLVYDVTALDGANKGRVRLLIEKFVGGGFAGQVYRVKLLEAEPEDGPITGLEAGSIYAMKILIPPSSFSLLFRNTLYWLGFQGPFQLQVNPAAARASALWQKFIRRGAKIRFGDETLVADIHATFVDSTLGSCGELSEWIDGRTWLLEVDDHLDLLKLWLRGKTVDNQQLGSPEYRAKRKFMAELVKLLHDMGGYEFARQYEWWSCKSQPNCLKRYGSDDPSQAPVAVDFKAGLTLLPFLPMSPGDFKLIIKGIMRGSIVQFDRGDLDKLKSFIQTNSDEFADMAQMLDELKAAEQLYRDSVPDITHNHIRLISSRQLRSTILDSAITGWKTKNLIDEQQEQKLRKNKTLTLLFYIIGLIPLLGRFLRKLWGRLDWRKHYIAILTSRDYLQRAVKAKIAEKVIPWHRAGRINDERALRAASRVWRFLYHLPLSVLPVGLHRFLTDAQYAKQRLAYLFVRPVRLYFDAETREQWLHDMVAAGQKKHILNDEDAQTILSQLKEPFIQKYLKSLAVHICTLPVTQIVSVLIAVIYVLMHPEMPKAQSWGIGVGIIALFQVMPISPGSLVRGFYVLYLVIRERNFRDYNIAVFLGFFKYIGYLAFPIQMTYHYPALARFMASHWATEAVHIVPVFGETGALLEHWVFRLFYNWPLTIKRRMHNRAQMRASIKPRYWHVGLGAIVVAGIFGFTDFVYLNNSGEPPDLKDIWWLAILISLVCGAVVTLGCGGAALWKRIVAALCCGIIAGLLYAAVSALLSRSGANATGEVVIACIWRVFAFAIFSSIGAIVTELKLPDPDLG